MIIPKFLSKFKFFNRKHKPGYKFKALPPIEIYATDRPVTVTLYDGRKFQGHFRTTDFNLDIIIYPDGVVHLADCVKYEFKEK